MSHPCQTGEFTITVNGMPVLIEQDGMFGTGSHSMYWPGFGAHAVDYGRPFISETGFRSFHGHQGHCHAGIKPDIFTREIIQSHIQRECKGKLRNIERSYLDREMARRQEKTTSTQQEQDL